VNNNPNSNTTANSGKLYKLNSNTNKTGLGITLKVMAGDRIDIFGKSYYFQNNTGGTGANSAIPVLDILTGLLGGPTGGTAAAAHGGVTASQLNGIGNVTGGITTLLGDQTTDAAGTPTVPKAYINYIFFDEQFKVAQSGFSRAGSNSVVKTHTDLTNKTAPKNGYVYIYVSNESPVDVFFDNLQVIHTRGAILEETHYYPFGLTMAGISSKALAFGNPKNKRGYNGNEIQDKEFSDGSGLEFYDFNARTYDQQIGRFLQIDSLSEQGGQESLSPYHFGKNNPVRYNDPDGKCPMCLIPFLPAIGEALVAAATATIAYIAIDKNKENLNQLTNNISNSLNSTSEEVGSYTNTHESGKKYHGKGPQSRADQSAKEKEKTYNDPLASQDWAPAPNDAEAFKQEAERIRNDGGVTNPNNYNKRNSPGEKELKKQDAQKGSKTIVQPNTGSTIVNLTITTISIIASWFN